MKGKMEMEILWILACDYEFANGHTNRNAGIRRTLVLECGLRRAHPSPY